MKNCSKQLLRIVLSITATLIILAALPSCFSIEYSAPGNTSAENVLEIPTETDVQSEKPSENTYYFDECGTPSPNEHEHTYEWVKTETTHQRAFTCGCNLTDDLAEHSYGDGYVCEDCGFIGGENAKNAITKLTYKKTSYKVGGSTWTYVFNFADNVIEAPSSLAKAFSDEAEDALLNKLSDSGLFDLKEKYSLNASVSDGGSWELTLEFKNGETKKSIGINKFPTSIFNKCSTAFYEICGSGVVATVPSEYYTPPNVSYSFEHIDVENVYVSNGYNSYGKRLNYKWNGFESTGNKIYEANKGVTFPQKFEVGIDYSLVLYTKNYHTGEYSKEFTKCTVTSYDFNENLTNETEIYSDGWFDQISIKIEINKIYVIRFEFENGDFVEYTFNTQL